MQTGKCLRPEMRSIPRLGTGPSNVHGRRYRQMRTPQLCGCRCIVLWRSLLVVDVLHEETQDKRHYENKHGLPFTPQSYTFT